MILVTGATGNIWREVVNLLLSGGGAARRRGGLRQPARPGGRHCRSRHRRAAEAFGRAGHGASGPAVGCDRGNPA